MNTNPNPEPNAESFASPDDKFPTATLAALNDGTRLNTSSSPEKISANRRNAQLSTGPRTAKGKAASRLNAVKHGVLARTMLVRGLRIEESPREFKTLRQEFHRHLAPVGPLEEMLVDQIVQAAWRLRRARKAESGEIALSVDTGCATRARANPLSRLLSVPAKYLGRGLVTHLRQSTWGCEYLVICLEELREQVAAAGELTEAGLEVFKKQLRNDPDSAVRELQELRVWRLANPEALDPETLRSRHQADVLQFLDEAIDEMEMECMGREQEEKVRERSKQSAAMVPNGDILDRVLRYEKALERQLFGAMNQLAIWQRRRQGGEVAAPTETELSA